MEMAMSRFLGLVVVAAAVAGMIRTVDAESAKEETGLELCNRTRLAVVYAKALNVTSNEAKAKGEKQVITSEGWFNLPAGDCAILYPGQLQYRYYMLYAEAKNSNRRWTGKLPICVNKGDFKLTGETCPPSRDHRLFMEVDTGESLSYTYDLN
jgi:uncharacterized membrane protein